METAISQKDALIKSMEAKIDNIRRQTEEEIQRQSKLREEQLEMKLNHNNQVTEYTHTLRKKEHELEELKHEHYVVTQERLNNLIKEKSQLRDTFENSILKLKEAHVKDMTSLNSELTREKDHSVQLSEELRKLRIELEDRLKQLGNDKNAIESSVHQCRKLNEMQVEENQELKRAVDEFRKENDMLNREIKLLNEECNKLRMDNDDLRNSCVKLDKIVYGKKDKKKK
jgi:chromosome segregation ATPase